MEAVERTRPSAGNWRGGARAGGGFAFLAAPLMAQVLLLSGVLNLLQLSTSAYMLRIYDHVLPSQSLGALGMLTGLVLGLHAGFALLDMVRSRLLFRAGLTFVQSLDIKVLDVVRTAPARRGFEALGDVERISRFVTNSGPSAFFDMVWAPAFLVAVALLHPVLGLFALAGILLLVTVAVSAELHARDVSRRLTRKRHQRAVLVRDLVAACAVPDGCVRCLDIAHRWRAASRGYYRLRACAARRSFRFGALAKGLRFMLQSGGLAVGALLVIEGAMSPGALIASSIILGRIFACFDAGIAHWRDFSAARESHDRIAALLAR